MDQPNPPIADAAEVNGTRGRSVRRRSERREATTTHEANLTSETDIGSELKAARESVALRGQAAFGELIRIAIPLILSVACFSITLFTDRTLLMWYGPESSAASMAAGNLYWTVACIPITALGFVTPLVAAACTRSYEHAPRHRGGVSTTRPTDARRDRTRRRIDTARLVMAGIWIVVFSIPAWWLLGQFAETIFRWADHAPSLAAKEATYFRLLLWVAPAAMLEACLGAFFVGRRHTRPVLIANVGAAVINVLLDVWFIFGGLGLPAGGVFGAAAATMVASWAKAAGLFVFVVFAKSFRRVLMQTWHPRLESMLAILLPGSTLGIQQLIRSAAMSFVLIRIGSASINGLAATTAAMSLYQFITIPMVGLATAITVVTGQNAKRFGNPEGLRTIGRGWLLGIGGFAIAGAVMVASPHTLLQVFLPPEAVDATATTANAANTKTIDLPLLDTAAGLLRLAVLYGVVDLTLLVLGAGLKGLQRTMVLLLSTLFASLIALLWARSIPNQPEAVWQWWQLLIAWAAIQILPLLWTLRGLAVAPKRLADTHLATRQTLRV